jgi:hypothetical protein
MKSRAQSELTKIPGIGPSMAADLVDLGIYRAADLKGKSPQALYEQLCRIRKARIDRCVLYVFRCAVYFAENDHPEPELLKWWNWKNIEYKNSIKQEMEQTDIMRLILDNWNAPVIFADNEHIIRYMNSAAREHYARFGDVIGKSIFQCHNQKSGLKIREIYDKLAGGEEEVLYADNEKHRVYMRGVRNPQGELLGYCERYEAPLKK